MPRKVRLKGQDVNKSYVDLFRRIAQIVKLDYAAHDVWEDRDHTTKFIDELTFYVVHSVVSDARFARIAGKYLACFGDPRLRLRVNHDLSPYKRYDYGIALRRFGNALYVEESANPQFRKGDRILAADYRSIAELADMNAPCFFGAEAERQVWEETLHFCRTVSIERDGRVADVRLDKATASSAGAANRVASLSDGIVLVELHALEDARDIEQLVDGHAEQLQSAKGIVLDIRDCAGTCDEALSLLAPLVADAGMRVSDFLEESCLVNYSARNCELLEESLALCCGDPEVDDVLREIRERRGAGLAAFSCDVPGELHRAIEPQLGCKVAVLVDRRCRDTAETLAELCKAASRCVLVGRNSSGTSGTLLPLRVALDERFSLEYPIARLSEEALIRHGSGAGIAVDHFVPWTPEHLRRDVDADAACDLLFADLA